MHLIGVILLALIGCSSLQADAGCPVTVDNTAVRATYQIHNQNTFAVSSEAVQGGAGFFEFPNLIVDITPLRNSAIVLNETVGYHLVPRTFVSTPSQDEANRVLSAALHHAATLSTGTATEAPSTASVSWFDPSVTHSLTSLVSLRTSGMYVRGNPQGMAERYASKLGSMGVANSYVAIKSLVDGSTLGFPGSRFLIVHVAVAIDPLANYRIDTVEEFDVYANEGFFGDTVLTDCYDRVYLGRVVVLPSDRHYKNAEADVVSPVSLFFEITTFVVMILTALGLRLSDKVADGVTLATMGRMTCAGPREERLLGTYRILAPFALDETLEGMLGGNCIGLACIWVVGWLLTVLYGRLRQAKSMEEAGSYFWFPRVPMMASLSLYPALAFLSFRLVVFGVSDEGSGGRVAGGIAALIVFLILVPILMWRYATLGLTGEFVPYNVKNVNCVWRFVLPTGRWVPDTLIASAGGIFAEMHCRSKLVVLLPLLSPACSGLIAAISPTTNHGCMVQYVLLTVWQMLLVILFTWFQPYRSRLDNLYAVLAHILLSIVAVIQGISADESIIAEYFFLPEILLMILSWLRFLNDVIVVLMDRASIPMAPPATIIWHDGSRNMEDLFKVEDPKRRDMLDADEDDNGGNILPANQDDNAIQGFGHLGDDNDDDPLRSPIVMSNPLPPSAADLKNMARQKEKDEAQLKKALEKDPFESDDEAKKPSRKSSVVSFVKSPSIRPTSPPTSLTPQSSTPAKTPAAAADEDDDDPFADNPAQPASNPVLEAGAKVGNKMKGIAKKLLLAAKFKALSEESATKRKEDEMFGDKFEDDALRGPRGNNVKIANEAKDQALLDDILGTKKPEPVVNPIFAHGTANAMANATAAPTKQPKGGDFARGAIAAPSLPGKGDPIRSIPEKDTVLVFRVEYSTKEKKMILEKQEDEMLGTFYDGDSYVVLNTIVPKKAGEPVKREVYLWIGAVSTPDEISAAENEAVVLDNKLTSSFHSEVTTGGYKITRVSQNQETTSFSSLFPNQSINVVEGGVDAEGKQQPRLYHVHGEGARKMSLSVVPPVVASLDNGDVFILDCIKQVFVFQGETCSPFEKEFARQHAEKLKQTRAICNSRTVTQDDAPEAFWNALGITQKEGRAMELVRTTNLHPSSVNRLWKCKIPTNGRPTAKNTEFTLVASGSDVGVLALDTHSVMIVDFCSVVFVWVGTEVKPYRLNRDAALDVGVLYLQKHSDDKVPLVRVLENFEGDTFDDMML